MLENRPEGDKEGVSIPLDSPEWIEYNEFLKKTYGPYFMDYTSLIPSGFDFSYQSRFSWKEDIQYQMIVSDIKVTQSENETSPKNYHFTAQVDYKYNAGKVSRYEIKGMAILSEEGKIAKFKILDDGGLSEKTKEDLGYK